MERTSCLVALKPSYYTIIVQYTIFTVRPGNNRLPRSSTLARGNTHFPRIYFPRTSGLARGKHHIPRTSTSHPKSTPPSVTGLREPPYKPAWLREIPYTTIGIFHGSPECLLPNSKLGRVSPYSYEASPPLPNSQLGRVSPYSYEASPPLSGL